MKRTETVWVEATIEGSRDRVLAWWADPLRFEEAAQRMKKMGALNLQQRVVASQDRVAAEVSWTGPKKIQVHLQLELVRTSAFELSGQNVQRREFRSGRTDLMSATTTTRFDEIGPDRTRVSAETHRDLDVAWWDLLPGLRIQRREAQKRLLTEAARRCEAELRNSTQL